MSKLNFGKVPERNGIVEIWVGEMWLAICFLIPYCRKTLASLHFATLYTYSFVHIDHRKNIWVYVVNVRSAGNAPHLDAAEHVIFPFVDCIEEENFRCKWACTTSSFMFYWLLLFRSFFAIGTAKTTRHNTRFLFAFHLYFRSKVVLVKLGVVWWNELLFVVQINSADPIKGACLKCFA